MPRGGVFPCYRGSFLRGVEKLAVRENLRAAVRAIGGNSQRLLCACFKDGKRWTRSYSIHWCGIDVWVRAS